MEQQEIERYKSYVGLIIYFISFFVIATIAAYIVAKVYCNDLAYAYKDVLKANSSNTSDLKLLKYAAEVNTLGNSFGYIITLIALVTWLFMFLKADIKKFIPSWKKNLAIMVIGGIIFSLISVGFDKFDSHVLKEISNNQRSISDTFKYGRFIPLMFIVTCFVAPVVEELVFRKCIFNLCVGKKAWIPIILSSVVFSLIHVLSTPIGAIWIVLYIQYFICALMLGCIYKYSGENIYVSMFVHILNNIVGCLIILL